MTRAVRALGSAIRISAAGLGGLLAVCMGASAPAQVASASDTRAAVVFGEAVLGLPLDARAGVTKAGMLCLPSGRLHVGDFVASEREFSERARHALDGEESIGAASRPLSAPSLRIVLTGIEADMCARKYGIFGLGNRRALSGRVEFDFSWSILGDDAVKQEHIVIDVAKSSAKPSDAILPDALSILAKRIRAVRNGAGRP
jgi:hypothetical protein